MIILITGVLLLSSVCWLSRCCCGNAGKQPAILGENAKYKCFLQADTWGEMSVTAECIGDYLTGNNKKETIAEGT